MTRSLRLLALVALVLATPCSAAQLAPSKASSVLTVATGIAPCLVNGHAIDTVQNADGTTSPFVIPPKQVFVVTSAETTLAGASASTSVSTSIRRVVGSTTNTLSDIDGTANAQGQFYGQLTIPSGAIVKPGVSLCVLAFAASGSPGVFTVVHGFFAPNK